VEPIIITASKAGSLLALLSFLMASNSDTTTPTTPPRGTNVTEESPLFTPERSADDASRKEDSSDSSDSSAEHEDNIPRRHRAPDPNRDTLHREDSFPLPVMEPGTIFRLEPGCAHFRKLKKR
jgi:hypothetical protein